MDAAFYRCEVKHIQRSKGRSVVAAAAYRARTRLEDERQGMTFEYGAKARERLVYSAVLAPYSWAEDRQVLWNAAERAEKRGDAQTGTEILVGLSCDLSEEQNIELLEGFVQEQFVDSGFAVDFNYHDSPRLNGEGRQPHAHILRTKRRVCADGLAPTKARDMDTKEALCELREAWAGHYNRALAKAGIDKRADHRSLAVIAAEAEADGDLAGQIEFDRLPEPKIGPVATQMVREGRGEEAHSYADAMTVREDRYERIEAARIVRGLIADARAIIAEFPQHLRAAATDFWHTVQAVMGARGARDGAERERVLVGNENPDIDTAEMLPANPLAQGPAPIVHEEEDGVDGVKQRKRRSLIVDAARSLATSFREASAARTAAAARREAEVAKAALERNLRLAEQAAFIGIDRLSPEADQSFANDWVRTLRSTDGPLEARYLEADRVALRNYALRMNRYPAIGELEKVLVRLSPSAGGVAMDASGAPRSLPEGLKADFRDRARYSEHVRYVMRHIEKDAVVAEHLRDAMKRTIEADSRDAEVCAKTSQYHRHRDGNEKGEPGMER